MDTKLMIDVFIMDMGGYKAELEALKDRFPHATVLRFHDNYLEMTKRAAAKARTEYFWLLSTFTDYTGFDFNWLPPVGQEYQIHTWQRNTFLVPTAEFLKQQGIEKLAWYRDINYHEDDDLCKQLPWPVIEVEGDDLAEAVKNATLEARYTEFRMSGTKGHYPHNEFLWTTQKDRPILANNRGSPVSLVPREAKLAIKTQIYDWPYIQYHQRSKIVKKPQDIVFISYDEQYSDDRYSSLLATAPRAKRVHGVSGVLNALKEAARIAETEYFYAVFGKTRVFPSFDFDLLVIDWFREPANYVFLAYNPILKSSYGHGGIVLHNTKFLRECGHIEGDVTTAFNVVTVPIVSCYIEYDTPFDAWRTAFREVWKLSKLPNPTTDNLYALSRWCECGFTPLGKYSMDGATLAKSLVLSGTELDINNWDLLHSIFTVRIEQ